VIERVGFAKIRLSYSAELVLMRKHSLVFDLDVSRALMTGMANTEHLPVFIQANDRNLS